MPLLFLIVVGALTVALGIALAPYIGWIVLVGLVLLVLAGVVFGGLAVAGPIFERIQDRLKTWADFYPVPACELAIGPSHGVSTAIDHALCRSRPDRTADVRSRLRSLGSLPKQVTGYLHSRALRVRRTSSLGISNLHPSV